jgi:hypothetical protein
LRLLDGPAPFEDTRVEEKGTSSGTMSLSCDLTDLWPLSGAPSSKSGVRDLEPGADPDPLLDLVRVGEGKRCSAAVDGLISSLSSSESEEGKKRSGSLFCLVGAAGDGDGENVMVESRPVQAELTYDDTSVLDRCSGSADARVRKMR